MNSCSRYSRLSIALQNYLLGARYYTALRAYDYAKRVHTGTRKDGITPEFQHQIEIALFITTLRDVQDEEGCIVAALFHDILEDYPNIAPEDIRKISGEEITQSVIQLSKTIHSNITYDVSLEYFNNW